MTSRSRNGLVCAVVIAIAMITVVSCNSTDYGGSNGGGGTQPATYSGVVSGANTSGTLALTVAAYAPQQGMMRLAASTVSVTGTLTLINGTTINLAGTFDTGTGAITVTGGGYTFTGTIVSGQIQGQWSGNGDQGFFTALVSTGSGVALFCGTYSGASSGTWNLALSGTTLVGSFKDGSGSGAGFIWGTASGTSLDLSYGAENTVLGTATGTVTGGTVSGNWQNGAAYGGGTGTFSGSTSACGTAR